MTPRPPGLVPRARRRPMRVPFRWGRAKPLLDSSSYSDDIAFSRSLSIGHVGVALICEPCARGPPAASVLVGYRLTRRHDHGLVFSGSRNRPQPASRLGASPGPGLEGGPRGGSRPQMPAPGVVGRFFTGLCGGCTPKDQKQNCASREDSRRTQAAPFSAGETGVLLASAVSTGVLARRRASIRA